MAQFIDESINKIRNYLKESGMAKSRLAVTANVPEGCTRKLDRDDWNPTAETLRKLEKSIDKSPRVRSKKTRTT